MLATSTLLSTMLTSKPSPPDGPIAQAWLEALLNAFAQRSVQAIAVLFLPNGWLRDELVFSWNTRALGGQDAITSYLAPALSGNEQRVPRNLKLAPELLWTTDSVPEVVELAFTFETDVIWGRGIAKLVKDGNDKWKAQLMFVTAKDLKRHEEVIETTPPKYLNAALLNSKVGRIANDREPYVVVGASRTHFTLFVTNHIHSRSRSNRTSSCGASQAAWCTNYCT